MILYISLTRILSIVYTAGLINLTILECMGQVRSGQVRSGQVRSGQVRSGQVRSGQVRSGQSGQVRSGQVVLFHLGNR